MRELGQAIRQLLPEAPYALRWVDGPRLALRTTFPAIHVSPGLLDEHLRQEVAQAMDVSVGRLLGDAWSKLVELHEFRGPSGGHGDVTLAEHTIEGDYRPTLTITVQPPPPPPWTIPFVLRLKIDVGGVTLGVGGGKIEKVSLVNLALEVEVLWGETTLFTPIQTGPLPVGTIELREGIAIP